MLIRSVEEALPTFYELPVLDPLSLKNYDLGNVIGLDPDIEKKMNGRKFALHNKIWPWLSLAGWPSRN